MTKVLLIGVGGVGGFVLEALIRSGFRNITIIDGDVIDASNLNRQIIALQDNLTKSKVLEAKKRAYSINPNINLEAINNFLTKDNLEEYVNKDYDYIIDACDDIDIKVGLIKLAQENNIKIITCLGTARRLDISGIQVTK